MKKLVCLAFVCLLCLVGCASDPFPTPVPMDTPVETVKWPGEYGACLLANDTTATAAYYNLEANKLEFYKSGDYGKNESAPASRTVEFGEDSYPMYYSITTRPAGYLDEVDAYVSSDSNVTMEFLKGTDTLVTARFMDNYPKLDGEANKETCIKFVESLLPDGVDLKDWEVYYDDETGFGQLVLSRVVSGILTAENITLFIDSEGHISEFCWTQPYLGEKVADVEVSSSALQVLVEGCLKAAYKAPANPIKLVEVAAVSLGADLDGSHFFSATVIVEYEDNSVSGIPLTLDILLYPLAK